MVFRGAVFAVVAASIDLAVGLMLGLYRGRRRVASLEEIVSIMGHLVVVTAIAALVNVRYSTAPIPLGASLGAGLFALFWVSAARALWRNLLAVGARGNRGGRRTIIFGAGDAASHVITALLSEPDRESEPVASSTTTAADPTA